MLCALITTVFAAGGSTATSSGTSNESTPTTTASTGYGPGIDRFVSLARSYDPTLNQLTPAMVVQTGSGYCWDYISGRGEVGYNSNISYQMRYVLVVRSLAQHGADTESAVYAVARAAENTSCGGNGALAFE